MKKMLPSIISSYLGKFFPDPAKNNGENARNFEIMLEVVKTNTEFLKMSQLFWRRPSILEILHGSEMLVLIEDEIVQSKEWFFFHILLSPKRYFFSSENWSNRLLIYQFLVCFLSTISRLFPANFMQKCRYASFRRIKMWARNLEYVFQNIRF